jgi:hypothetical protein
LLSIFCCAVLSAVPGVAAEPPSGVTLYHADPQHLWNRLHAIIFVRTGPDGRAYGHDRLEPLLWHQTKHVLEGRANDRAVAVLKEFINDRGENLVADPVKRAILQRDLWLVFSWLEYNRSDGGLRRPLATVIGRLALTADQIEGLPDNYAAAVASEKLPKSYDSTLPDQPYLPDLFATDGDWVCINRADGPAAREHVREDFGNPFTNSAFLVFLRLPGGRSATLEFLKELREFDEPLLARAEGRFTFLPNPKLPPIPVGTETALVRRALLVDSSQEPRASSLTESVQLRVYRDVPAINAQTLNAALVSGTAANAQARQWQVYHEFRLSRALLFADSVGGLRASGADERDFKTGFRAHGWDPFEREQSNRPFPDAEQQPIRQTCVACHSLPGLMSLNSYSNGWRDGLMSGKAQSALLSEAPVVDALASGVAWKKSRPDWIALRDLLAE